MRPSRPSPVSTGGFFRLLVTCCISSSSSSSSEDDASNSEPDDTCWRGRNKCACRRDGCKICPRGRTFSALAALVSGGAGGARNSAFTRRSWYHRSARLARPPHLSARRLAQKPRPSTSRRRAGREHLVFARGASSPKTLSRAGVSLALAPRRTVFSTHGPRARAGLSNA